jgi:hypothetical protein
MEVTAPFAADLRRGRWDLDFFSTRFLAIEPHPGQQRLWRTALLRTPSGWRAAYLTIAVSAGNRAGKTLALAILILHNTLYKMGLQPPDSNDERSLMTYSKAEYLWFHFGIQQETAELVFNDILRILSGTHEAQKNRGCPLADELGRDVAETSKKYRGDYPWVVFHEVLGGGEVHFRSTSERAIGSLGRDMHGVSFDECAFEPQLEFVVNEVLHLRRLGTGGQLLLVSTATEGLTSFADIWSQGDPEYADRKASAMSLKISTRENIGYGLDQETFDRLVADMPPYLIPQNIDGGFVESRSAFFGSQAVDAMFSADLPEEDLPRQQHRYAQGVDPALTYDSSWAITLDMTDARHLTGVRARRKSGRQTTLSVSAMVSEGHRSFSSAHTWCSTVLDATGFGGKVFKDLLADLHPLRCVEFGGTRSKKLRLLLDLKSSIEGGKLKVPRSGLWLTLRRQLLGYRLEDRKLETDAVMALALAVREARRQPSETSDGRFEFFGDDVPSPLDRARILGRIGVMGR